MGAILAIDTATDACSVALYRDGVCAEQFELIPRQHSQRLFTMLQALLPDGRLCRHGIDAIAYSSGPGSFTGLRIGASAVQGLAFANSLPAIAVSTLACQAQTALRLGVVGVRDTVVSMLDARIGELYYASCRYENGLAVLQHEAAVCAPADLGQFAGSETLHGIGSGCALSGDMPAAVRVRFGSLHPAVLPAARDLVPLALAKLERGDTQLPHQVRPLYVRDEISWKKISEQGPAR
jgi:tRNA threonylcarbamoyladenosine biosynthesis protein TsaB